jgi:hypothetical protein
MGADIHTYVEQRIDGVWRHVDVAEPDFPGMEGDGVLGWRHYGMFGFLANVRNYSHSPVIAEPRGLPDDVTEGIKETGDWQDAHSHSWLTLAELLAYDYDQVFWDRRITRDGNGAALAGEGEGEHTTLRSFLGEWFFKSLDELSALGPHEDIRIVFWFDD